MKNRQLSKEAAKQIFNHFIKAFKEDYGNLNSFALEKDKLQYLQDYFNENYNIEDCLGMYSFEVNETEGCCGVGQLCDLFDPKNIADIEIALVTSEASEYTLLKYYSVDKNLTSKLKQLGFVVDRVWYNFGSGNKVTELTYDANTAGAFKWPTFSDIQAVLGVEAVMRELSTLMDQSSASPAKTTKRRCSTKV